MSEICMLFSDKKNPPSCASWRGVAGVMLLRRSQSFDSMTFPRDCVPRWMSSLAQLSGCMETERVTAVRPLALADFLPLGRPDPLRGPPWVGLFSDFDDMVVFLDFVGATGVDKLLQVHSVSVGVTLH